MANATHALADAARAFQHGLHMRLRPLPTLLLVTAWWTLYGVASTSQALSMEGADGQVMPLARAAMIGFGSAWLWIPLTLLLLWGVQRYPLERGRLARHLPAIFALVLLIVVLRALAVLVLNPWIGWYRESPEFPTVLVASLANNLLLLWLMVGAFHAWLYAARAREREHQAARLEADLAGARLQLLASQLNPHFMFNALNSIAEAVHQDPEVADRMLVGLGALLRSSLERQSTPQVPLREELALLRHYLDIESLRLGDRLRVEWRIGDGVDEVPVPPLLLQPLAENAIVHALALRTAPGCLVVEARREGRVLHLAVSDDGGAPAATARHGHGLANLRARLQQLHGTAASLQLLSNARGGTTARVVVPCAPAREVAA